MQPLEYRDLELEAFVHATESVAKVEAAIRIFAGGVPIERQALGGHFGQPLVALRARVADRSQIRETLDRVQAAVGPDIARTAAKRVDKDLILHMRFDKQSAARGVVALDLDPANDIVKVRVRLRAPRLDPQAAVALVQREFGGPGWKEEE